jgi:RNA polymerase sigma-70 factor (ECF subfamily)
MRTLAEPEFELFALSIARGPGAPSPPADELKATDTDLLGRAQRGEQEACRELLRRYGARLLQIIRVAVKDGSLAEDIVQETFVKAIAESSQLREDASFFAWLVRIGIRVGLDQKRKRRHETLFDELPEQASDSASPERRALESEDGAKVRAALSRLKDYPRELIVLRYFAGFSAAELAAVFGKSDVAIRKDLERARGRMKKLLQPWFEASRGAEHG